MQVKLESATNVNQVEWIYADDDMYIRQPGRVEPTSALLAPPPSFIESAITTKAEYSVSLGSASTQDAAQSVLGSLAAAHGTLRSSLNLKRGCTIDPADVATGLSLCDLIADLLRAHTPLQPVTEQLDSVHDHAHDHSNTHGGVCDDPSHDHMNHGPKQPDRAHEHVHADGNVCDDPSHDHGQKHTLASQSIASLVQQSSKLYRTQRFDEALTLAISAVESALMYPRLGYGSEAHTAALMHLASVQAAMRRHDAAVQNLDELCAIHEGACHWFIPASEPP